eukprot:4512873-Amphidinium_carterae.1
MSAPRNTNEYVEYASALFQVLRAVVRLQYASSPLGKNSATHPCMHTRDMHDTGSFEPCGGYQRCTFLGAKAMCSTSFELVNHCA